MVFKKGEDLYAVLINKNWVEFRIAKNLPKKVRSRAKIPMRFKDWDNRGKLTTKLQSIELINFEGGRVIGCLPFKRYPINENCKLVPVSMKEYVLKEIAK